MLEEKSEKKTAKHLADTAVMWVCVTLEHLTKAICHAVRAYVCVCELQYIRMCYTCRLSTFQSIDEFERTIHMRSASVQVITRTSWFDERKRNNRQHLQELLIRRFLWIQFKYNALCFGYHNSFVSPKQKKGKAQTMK